MSLKTGLIYEYGPFRIEPDEHRLTWDGTPLPLAPKAFDLLVYLVQNSGRLLMKDELLRAVWPDSFVEEANLTVAISTIRKVLGEKEGGLRYIETVPTKGYRFIASVTEVRSEQVVAVSDEEPSPTSSASLPAPPIDPGAEAALPDAPVTPAPLFTGQANRRHRDE